MPTYKFDEVSIRGTKKWKDPATGKPRQQSRKFWQTISPFNRTTDGPPKTREQIMEELRAERAAWMGEG